MTEVRTYHAQPVIKQPTWTWEIPCYLFTGGLGGASAGLAYLCELRGEDEIARRSWAVATAALSVSPILLISDLGRPMRFVNMLRMVKVTSPMNIGSWILTVSGASTTVASANALMGWFPALSRVARPLAAIAGLPLSSYTGALLANTAIPAWHESRRLLPFLFVAGAELSAGAAALVVAPDGGNRIARRVAVVGAVAELALEATMEQQLGPHRASYDSKQARPFKQAARVLTAAGTLLAARRGGSRATTAAGGALLLAGALATRWSVYKAGFASAADPKATVGPQRERIERGERRGAARRASVAAAH
jgi:formate-dependent nitrite reductase membrane component NrfD